MEAVVALGVAGNTVQFLDFASKLCATSIEIYRDADGATSTNTHSELLLKSFIDTIDEVSRDLAKYFHALDAASSQAHNQGDVQIGLIIKDCQAIAKDLSLRFGKLKASGRPGKWKSFVTGLKCVWRKNELEELQKRLKKNREELEWRIMLSLPEGLNLLASRQEDQFRELQSAVVLELSNVIRDHVQSLPQWPDSIEQTLQQIHANVVVTNMNATVPSSSKRLLDKLAIRRVKTQTNSPTVNVSASFLDRYVVDCATKLAEIEEERWKSLSFQVMDEREDAIADVELRTFDWILQPPQAKNRPWSSFIEWLEIGSSIYWISGKAGCGKSTLMKYLKSHDRVQAALETWAVDTPLITASFFFWYNGNELQKTQEGLLRSLIYQALENHRELIPLVLAGTFDILSVDLVSYWTLARLKGAFRRLAEQKEVPLKICLLVDGLDEYAGNHAEIVEVFQYAAQFEHFKVCVSSRPLIVFDRAFKDLPGLRLQDLTFDDIQLYVRNRFHHDERFHELELEEPGLGPNLALQVVTKASGVFLWVKLVVNSLLEGIQNYDRGIDLVRRLNELPEDLTELYWHMLDRVKPVWYLEEGFRLLLLVRSTPVPLTLLRLVFAELQPPTKDDEVADLSYERQVALCKSMAGRIKSRCLGLIEVVDDPKSDETKFHVQFLHKSVADFIDTPEMSERIQRGLPATTTFRPKVAILRAMTTELKTIKSRLYKHGPNEHGRLNREALFDEIQALYWEAHRFVAVVKKGDRFSVESVEALKSEMNQTTTNLWES